MKLRAALELVRLPAVFTAPSDVLAGLAVAGSVGATVSVPVGVVLCLASACAYCAGMASNDLFDVAVDTVERPSRPIPSGRASIAAVWSLVGALQAVALLLAAWVGPVTLGAVALTIGLTYLYNGVLKESFFGPMAMGACRYGNFLIGASICTWPGSFELFIVPITVGLYVVALTWISRFEVLDSGPPAPFVGALLLLSLSPFGWILADVLPSRWGLALALLAPVWLAKPALNALREPSSAATRRLVMAGIFGIAMVNGAVALGAGATLLGLICVALLVPGRLVGRWFYST